MLIRTSRTKPLTGVYLNRAHPLSRNLLGAWLMNSPGGASYDLVNRSRIDHNGGVAWTSNARGIAARYNGSSTYSETPYTFQELNGLSQVTFSAWVFRISGTNFDGIITRSTNGSIGLELLLSGSIAGIDDFYFRASPAAGSARVATSDNCAVANRWLHVVGVFDGTLTDNPSRGKLYVDGVLKTVTQTGTFPATTATVSGRGIRFGRAEYGAGANNDYFNGLIDLPMIWTRALSPEEIKQLYGNPYQILHTQGQHPSLMNHLTASGGIFGNINNPILFG